MRLYGKPKTKYVTKLCMCVYAHVFVLGVGSCSFYWSICVNMLGQCAKSRYVAQNIGQQQCHIMYQLYGHG